LRRFRRFKIDELYDFAIVGSGAGGSTAAYVLSKMGLKVLLIEEGPDLRGQYGQHSPRWILDNAYKKVGLNAFFGLPPIPFGEGRLLGGTTELNGGLIWDTPKAVRDKWRSSGYLKWVSDNELNESWKEIELLLDVKTEKELNGFDLDSTLMSKGFKAMGLSTTGAQRATSHCTRFNRCAFGCPSGAKNSMGSTLIPLALEQGVRTLTDSRVVGIRAATDKDSPCSISFLSQGKIQTVLSHRVIIAAGPNDSPKLVRKVLKWPVLLTCKKFHLNVKIFALGLNQINAAKGTIFTQQMQEHLDEGLLIMPSQSGDEALLLAAAALKGHALQELLENWDKLSIFTVQLAVDKGAIQISTRFGAISFHALGKRDINLARKGIELLIGSLHMGGFDRYLTDPSQASFERFVDSKERVSNASFSKLDTSSVHAMATLPLNGRHIDCFARLRKFPTVYVMDASILPTETIESPQGSIMQTVIHVARRAGKDFLESRISK